MTREKLIEYYTKNLEKARNEWGRENENLPGAKGYDYIQCAKNDLEAVKNGRAW